MRCEIYREIVVKYVECEMLTFEMLLLIISWIKLDWLRWLR